MDLSNSVVDDEAMKEEWVVVKKRRIIILVPPAEESQSVVPKVKSTKSRRNIQISGSPKRRAKRISNRKSSRPSKKLSDNQHKIKDEVEKPSQVLPLCQAQANQGKSRYLGRNKNLDPSIASGNWNKRTMDNSHDHLSRIPLMQREPITQGLQNRNIVTHFERQTMMPSHKIAASLRRLPVVRSNVVDYKLRALNLERKLQLLGGLRTWLLSQGLERFICIFEREKVGIYQLVNLTMSKLKDMGANAVGPRRKLIYAIERLCRPSYFEDCQD
ncbi:uncharacterized protein LOC141832338 [Curcuma longa]|uniref:uncharacterized protein LOC141832338 n=1 Tax=Curcuma longa TaxID=136217 RepID=UPI003D9F182E